MPSAWRMVAPAYAALAFDGEGARLYGGRWNSPGRPAVYVAGSRALAALEILVHLSGEEMRLNRSRIEVSFESRWMETVKRENIEKEICSPVVTQTTQQIGDHWLQSGKRPVLQVWSSIIPEEKNYLLNPLHPDFKKIHKSPPELFTLDPRLI